MTDNFNSLNRQLLAQKQILHHTRNIEHYQTIAASYADLQGSIAVLSDITCRRSYLYYGTFAHTLGLKDEGLMVDDIWEKEVMGHIHSDDLEMKFIQELRFFNFIMRQPKDRRGDYCMMQPIRMCDNNGNWYAVIHKLIYVLLDNGELWASFCIYNPMDGCDLQPCFILEMATGRHLPLSADDDKKILSKREIMILKCIGQGMSSKEIAEKLFISVNTVNRHRQNIMEKLQAKSAIDACLIARRMNLI